MILINQILNNFNINENIKKKNLILSDYEKFFYISCIIIFLIILNKINITTNFIYSLLILFAFVYLIYYNEININKNEKLIFLNKYLNNKSYFENHKSFVDFLYQIKHFNNEVIYENLINNINLFLKYYDKIKINKNNIKISILKDISKNIFGIYESYIFNLSDKFDKDYQYNMDILFNLLNKHIDLIINLTNENININNTSILDNINDIFYVYN